MNSRKITFILVAAFALLVIAGTKVSQLTRTRSIQSTSRFLVSTQDATTGRWSSRFIEAPDLATNLGPWITNSGSSGSGTISSNGNQFAGVPLSIKSGVLITNGALKGSTTAEDIQADTITSTDFANGDRVLITGVGPIAAAQESAITTDQLNNLSGINGNIATNLAAKLATATFLTSSNDLYNLITAAGISASTATNIARYWATNAALQASNQLELVKAPKTNATLYGTVNINSGVANEILAYDASKNLTTVSGVTATEASFLDGLTENIQDALDERSTDALTNAATKDFGVANKVIYSKGLTPAAGWQYWDDFNTPMTTAGQFPDSPSGHRYTVLSTYGNTNQIVLTNGYWSMGNTGAIYMSITSQTNGVYGSIKPYNKWGGTFRYKRSTNNTTDGVDRNLTFILSTNADFITKPFLHVSIGINGFRVQKELSSTNIIYGYPYEGSRYLGFDTNYNFTLTIISNTLIAEIAGMTYMGTEPLLSTVYKDLRVATWESTGTHTNQHWGEWDAQYAGYASAQDFAMFGGPMVWATNFGLSSVTFVDGTTQATAAIHGTNNPVTFSGGTLTLIANQTSRHSHTTNASFAFTFSGTPNASSRAFYSVSNSAASTIYATNTSGIYDPTVGSNVTTFAISAQSERQFMFGYNSTGGWEMEWTTTKGAELAPGSNITFTTNGALITIASTASGGGGAGSLPMNANQFDTNATASLKSGALATNLNARGLTLPLLTASRAMILNGSSDPTNSPNVSATELEYLDGVTSAIQTQFQNITNGQARIADTNWHNVRAYGAVGDGSTDDAAAFKAAATNQNMYVPAGRYLIGSSIIKTNGTIRGDGISSILVQNFTGFLIDSATASQKVSLESIALDGQYASSATNAAAGSPARTAFYANSIGEVSVRNCFFRNFSAYGIYAWGPSDTTNTRDSKWNIEGNSFSNVWEAIELVNNRAEYSRISGNYFDNCGYGIVAGSANQLITGNHISDSYCGVFVLAASGVRNHNVIVGNTINHNVWPLIAVGTTGLIVNNNEIAGQGIILFTNLTGLQMQGNLIEATEMRFQGGGANHVRNNTFTTTLPTITHNYAGSTSRTFLYDNVTTAGLSAPAAPLLTLVAGASVTNNYTKIRVAGSGGAVTLTSTPTVPTNSIPDGWVIRIQGTDDTNTLTVQDDGTLADSDLSLGASTRVLGVGDVLTLTYDATLNQWFETGWSDN